MKNLVEKIFHLSDAGTDIKTEMIGGVTTFMTMAYIIFVQPAVLESAGMDFGSVMVATCISAAVGILLMAFLANYPIALASGMGQNFFFTYTVVLTMGISWQKGLGFVFWAGFAFVILSFFGVREKIIAAIPESLKHAIAVGIGLLITLIGLEWSGLIVDDPSLLVGLGNFKEPTTLLSIIGLFIMSILLVWKFPGAILCGIILTTVIGYFWGLIPYHGFMSLPPSIDHTFLKLDISGSLRFEFLSIIFVFFILDLFDTVGTLVGVSDEAGFMKEGKLPRAKQALFSDAVASVTGALFGTTTVTSYIESASGVAAGARTGFANIITALLFILALFFSPLVKMVGGGIFLAENVIHYPAIAPALILVGIFMIKGVRKIDWDDLSVGIPAFITIIFIPFAFRITEGIALGFIAYTVLKLATGKAKDVPFLMWTFTVIFLLRYIFIEIS